MDTNLKCVVCAAALYVTDQSIIDYSYHCSSAEARFWDFERGSIEQINSKDHWDKSKQEIPNRIRNEPGDPSIHIASE